MSTLRFMTPPINTSSESPSKDAFPEEQALITLLKQRGTL